MCPSAPVSPPHGIDDNVSDTEMFMHLENMMHGAPCPDYVLTDVDPSAAAPWDLPPRMLYFFNSKDPKSLKGEKGIKATEKGYWWLAMNDRSTQARTPAMGRISTLEFYRGRAPHGDKTDWVMREYTMDEYTMDQKLLGSSSLCRVFMRTDRSRFEAPQQPGADVANGDLEAILLTMLVNEENNNNLQESSNISQVLSRNEHGQWTTSGSRLQSLRPDNSAHDSNEAYDFSREYLEMNDLIGFASSSFSSENTCITSMDSEEFFDPEDLLRVLDTPSIPDSNQRNADCRFNVSASRGSHQVLIQPPPSGPRGSCSSNRNPYTKETVVSASIPMHVRVSNLTLPAVSIVEEVPNRKASASCEVNRGPSTSRGVISANKHGKRKAVGRFAKLRKKYCCFISF